MIRMRRPLPLTPKPETKKRPPDIAYSPAISPPINRASDNLVPPSFSDALLRPYDALPVIVVSVFLCSYSHATYIDHGGVHFCPVSCPQSARWRHVAGSHSPSAEGCPKENTKESGNGKATLPYPPSADAMKEGVGRNSGSPSPAPIPSAAPSSSASASRSSSRSRHSRSSHSDA